jgi:hypothetical protein
MENKAYWLAISGVVLAKTGMFALIADRPLRHRYFQTLTGRVK